MHGFCLFSAIRLLENFPRHRQCSAGNFCPVLGQILNSTYRNANLKTDNIKKSCGEIDILVILLN